MWSFNRTARKKKDGAPDLTPGTLLEDEEKMLSIRSPRDFAEPKDSGEMAIKDRSFMIPVDLQRE